MVLQHLDLCSTTLLNLNKQKPYSNVTNYSREHNSVVYLHHGSHQTRFLVFFHFHVYVFYVKHLQCLIIAVVKLTIPLKDYLIEMHNVRVLDTMLGNTVLYKNKYTPGLKKKKNQNYGNE